MLISNESTPKTSFYYKWLQNPISSPPKLWGAFLNVAMATPACNPPASRFSHLEVPRTFTLPNALERDRSFILFLDLELFAHFHAQKGFRSGLIYFSHKTYFTILIRVEL